MAGWSRPLSALGDGRSLLSRRFERFFQIGLLKGPVERLLGL